MEKNKKYPKNYVYGNVAYNLEPEINPRRKQIKRKKTNNKVKIKRKMVVSIVLIACISLLALSRFASVIKLTYDIRGIKSEIKTLQEANENIRVQIAKKSNIKSIEETAVNELGMVIPDKSQIVYIDVKPLTSLAGRSNEGEKTAANQFVQKIIGLLH